MTQLIKIRKKVKDFGHQQGGKVGNLGPFFLPEIHRFNNNLWTSLLCEKSENNVPGAPVSWNNTNPSL